MPKRISFYVFENKIHDNKRHLLLIVVQFSTLRKMALPHNIPFPLLKCDISIFLS